VADPTTVPFIIQIPVGAGGALLFAERAVALYQRLRKGNGEKRDSNARSALADTIEQTVRDTLSTQQLNFDLSLAEHRNDLRSFFDDLRGEFSQARQEIVQAIRERRR